MIPDISLSVVKFAEAVLLLIVPKLFKVPTILRSDKEAVLLLIVPELFKVPLF
jgi:hypothetical protein